jgi:hypothetical protein
MGILEVRKGICGMTGRWIGLYLYIGRGGFAGIYVQWPRRHPLWPSSPRILVWFRNRYIADTWREVSAET